MAEVAADLLGLGLALASTGLLLVQATVLPVQATVLPVQAMGLLRQATGLLRVSKIVLLLIVQDLALVARLSPLATSTATARLPLATSEALLLVTVDLPTLTLTELDLLATPTSRPTLRQPPLASLLLLLSTARLTLDPPRFLLLRLVTPTQTATLPQPVLPSWLHMKLLAVALLAVPRRLSMLLALPTRLQTPTLALHRHPLMARPPYPSREERGRPDGPYGGRSPRGGMERRRSLSPRRGGDPYRDYPPPFPNGYYGAPSSGYGDRPRSPPRYPPVDEYNPRR
ncbi:hypothetical protein JCM1840_000333 [Sporobolomyces johnsonii]